MDNVQLTWCAPEPALDDALEALRGEGDPLLDPIVTAEVAGGWYRALAKAGTSLPPPLDGVKVPRWSDPARLTRASRFFHRHAVPISMLLGTTSLLESYASVRGARALYATRRMYRQTGRRVGETGQFVLAMYQQGAWADGGDAHRALLRVRVLHAVSRKKLRDEGGWTEAPICQEDQLGTLLVFGLSPLLHLRALGVRVTSDDVEDALHLWRVAGHILGVRLDLFPHDEASAIALGTAIRARNFGPSAEAREMTKSLLDLYDGFLGHDVVRRLFHELLRDLAGGAVSDAVGIPYYPARKAPLRMGRSLGGALRTWELIQRVPGFSALAEKLLIHALTQHAHGLSGGPAWFLEKPDLEVAESPPPARAEAWAPAERSA